MTVLVCKQYVKVTKVIEIANSGIQAGVRVNVLCMANMNTFSNNKPELNSDGAIYMNMYNSKRARRFDSKIPFRGLIILEDALSNKLVIIYMALIGLYEGIVDEGFIIVEMVCHSEIMGTLRSMS